MHESAAHAANDVLRRARDATPLGLLALFLIVTFITTLTQAHRYGVTSDEPLQQVYGQYVLAWYRSFGHDTSFLRAFPSAVHMPEHGGIVDAVIAALQSWLPGVDPWLTRRIASGVIGWLGVVAIALCGLELGGPWVSLAAAVGLWLYPRYYGAMYNNPKDVPAAVSMLFALWMTLLLVRYWSQRKRAAEVAVLLGGYLGVATAIRVTAIIWFALLLTLVAGWWLIHGKAAWTERRAARALAWQGVIAAIITSVWLLVTAALWPFVFLSPLKNLVDSVQVLSHYPWTGQVLFNGVEYPAARLPVTYAPTWLAIGSPPLLLLLALLGVTLVVGDAVLRRQIDPRALTVALAFVIPFASLLLLHPVLYNALRQFLFIAPPLVLLAAYGLIRSVAFLWSRRRPVELRWLAAALVVVTIAGYAQVVADMAALSPYEYTYFSPLVGGLHGAAPAYDTDYYGTCGTAAAEWLSQNYPRYIITPAPSVGASDLLQASLSRSLPASFRNSDAYPDFFVGFTRDGSDQTYPSYRVIHRVMVEGVTLCVVKANPATTVG